MSCPCAIVKLPSLASWRQERSTSGETKLGDVVNGQESNIAIHERFQTSSSELETGNPARYIQVKWYLVWRIYIRSLVPVWQNIKNVGINLPTNSIHLKKYGEQLTNKRFMSLSDHSLVRWATVIWKYLLEIKRLKRLSDGCLLSRVFEAVEGVSLFSKYWWVVCNH